MPRLTPEARIRCPAPGNGFPKLTVAYAAVNPGGRHLIAGSRLSLRKTTTYASAKMKRGGFHFFEFLVSKTRRKPRLEAEPEIENRTVGIGTVAPFAGAGARVVGKPIFVKSGCLPPRGLEK